jgi:hypothetical protein
LWPETHTTYAAVAFRFPETAADEHCGEWKPKGLGAVATDELIERRDG